LVRPVTDGGAAGDHHHQVAGAAAAGAQQRVLHGGDHVVGVHDDRRQVGLDAPGQRQPAQHGPVRRERDDRRAGPVPGQPARGVAGLGEGGQRHRAGPCGHLDRGRGDRFGRLDRVVPQRRHHGGRVVLDLGDDPGHRRDRLHRMPSDAGLAGQHHRVSAVQHRVGHVGGLGPGRPRVLDHRLEHLGRDDCRLGRLPARLRGPLLHQRHPLQRHLHAEVAAGHHDPVERGQHRGQLGDRLRLLQLGQHRNGPALLGQHRPDRPGVGRRPDERQRGQVHPEREREPQVLGVLAGQRRLAHRDPGQGQALVIGHRAAFGHLADHVGSADGDDHQPHVAVVDQQPVARRDVVGQPRVRRRHPPRGAGLVLGGDRDPVAGAPLDRAVGEPAEAHLRALQVGEQADRAAGPLGRRPHPLDRLLVFGVGAVAEVEPGHVHARLDQRRHPLL
jgi:hypothetical protein